MPVAESTGQKTITITTNAANKLVNAGSGRLNAVLVNGTALNAANAIVFYDSATAAASGTIIGAISASSAAYTFQAYDIPYALGISVNDAAANSNVITVVYTVD